MHTYQLIGMWSLETNVKALLHGHPQKKKFEAIEVVHKSACLLVYERLGLKRT